MKNNKYGAYKSLTELTNEIRRLAKQEHPKNLSSFNTPSWRLYRYYQKYGGKRSYSQIMTNSYTKM